MKTGIELIAQERAEQIEKHGRTLETDRAENNHYQMSQAASLLCYSLIALKSDMQNPFEHARLSGKIEGIDVAIENLQQTLQELKS